MAWKKIAVQTAIAYILFVAISLILEKEYSQEIVYREMTEGLVFAAIYAVIIWISSKWRGKEKKE